MGALYSENDDHTHPTWDTQDGTLTSAGPKQLDNYSLITDATHKTGVENGIWDYDFFGPASGPFRVGFRILRFSEVNETKGTPQLLSPSHVQVIVNIGLDANGIFVENSPTVHIAQLFNDGVFRRGWYGIGDTPALNETQLRGWHHIQIEKNETHINVFLDNQYVTDGKMFNLGKDTYDGIGIWMDKGNGAKIDNIVIQSFKTKESMAVTLIFRFSGLAAVTVLGFGGRVYFKKRGIEKVTKMRKINLETIKSVNHEFDLSNKAIYSLFTGAVNGDNFYSEKRYKEFIPQEILTYRYLMHPIRLTIMKIPVNEDHMRSVDIKNALDISWSEYSTHVKSLEQNEYIEVQNEFSENGNVVQVVYALEFGRKQFDLLFGLLQQFVAKSSPYEYLLYAQANLKDKTLYPDKTGYE